MPELFDRECPKCGHDGMKQTQAPSRDGPAFVFKCPACGAVDNGDESKGGMYVSKR